MNNLKTRLRGFTRLARPANLPTAIADIWAGAAIAYGITNAAVVFGDVLLLSAASLFLYAAGVVLNDVFDASIDAIERPERPIPKGMVSRQSAFIFGTALILAGILTAFLQGELAGILSLFLVFCILVYDGWAKHLPFVGPLFMGMCRAINLLVGLSILGVFTGWYYAFIPLAYIFAVTQISRGEVYGNNKASLVVAGIVYAFVISGVLYLSPDKHQGAVLQLIMLVVFGAINFWYLIRAFRQNHAANIKKAVIAGVLGIIVLDAAMASAYAPLWAVALILALLPLSAGMSRIFKVT